jgi:hypothetical protein
MRPTSLVLAVVAGITAGAFATQAGAVTGTSSAGVRAGLAVIDTTEAVHCRAFPHRHWHGYNRGCRVGEVDVRVRHGARFEHREGVRGRVGIESRSSTTRSQTNVRSRESTSVRSGSSTSGRSEMRTGTRSGSSSGTSGSKSGGSTSGGQSGQSSGGQSGSTGQSPSGGGQQTR